MFQEQVPMPDQVGYNANQIEQQPRINLRLIDAVGTIVELATTTNGSKFIQSKLNEATHDHKEMVFQEVIANFQLLVLDPYGNYVVQKFFDVGTPDQQKVIVDGIRDNFLPFAIHKHGSRVVQKAIEAAPLHEQMYLVHAADKGAILRMATDVNGSHVIQKIFRVAQVAVQDIVFASLVGGIYTLCVHPHGARVIQRVLEKGTFVHLDHIYDTIIGNFVGLVDQRFGNIVIQYVIYNLEDWQLFHFSEVLKFSKRFIKSIMN